VLHLLVGGDGADGPRVQGDDRAGGDRGTSTAAAALKARAKEFVGFMRDMAELIEEEAASERQRPVKRARRPNAKYFGPEWIN
jgi:hypothetical protein